MGYLFDAFNQGQRGAIDNENASVLAQLNKAKLEQTLQDQDLQNQSRQVGMQIAQTNLAKQTQPAVNLSNIQEVPDAGLESMGKTAEVAIPTTAKVPKQSELLSQQADELKTAALKFGSIGNIQQQTALMKESDNVREKLYLTQKEERTAEAQKQKEAAGAVMAVNSQEALDNLWGSSDPEHRKSLAPLFNIGLDGKPIYDEKGRAALDYVGNKVLDSAKQNEFRVKAINQELAATKAENERLNNVEKIRVADAKVAAQREGVAVKKEVADNIANAPGLNPEAIESAASRYNIDGTLPPNLGRGTQGAAITAKILSRAAEIAKESGDSPEATRIGQLANKASAQALGQLTKQEQMVGAFEKNALKNLDIAVNASKEVDRTGIPVLNRWLLAGKKSLAGDPAVSKFHAANTTFVNEYAKIMSGSMGNTVVSDSLRKETETLLATKDTPEQYEAVTSLMKQEMANRMKGFAEQKAELTGSMKKGTPNRRATDSQFTEGQVYQDASGNKAKYVKGQWVPQ